MYIARSLTVGATLLVLAGTPISTARAQTGTRPANPAFDIQLYYPSPGASGFLTTESADVNLHLEVSAGLTVNYAHRPLEVTLADGLPIGPVIENRLDTVLTAAIGLFGFADIGIVFPIVAQGGPVGLVNDLITDVPEPFASAMPGFTAGDLRIVPKIRPVTISEGLFSLALIPTVVLPTGGGAVYASERQPVFAPTVAISSRFLERYRVALNVGYRWRETGTDLDFVGIVVKDEIFAKLAFAARFEVLPDMHLEILGEIFGHTPAKNGFGLGSAPDQRLLQEARTALEADGGVRLQVLEYLWIFVGGGSGLAHGIGGPAPRVFGGVTFYTGDIGPPDLDNDDIPDDLDQCPTRPEDRDDFEDEDGCPEVDNDRDRVLDEDDECPAEPEDQDGYEDHDGCPDPDNDGDGVLDAADRCPDVAEDVDGFEDTDGCPDLDNDQDGIADTVDKCPTEPEDLDDFADHDGCPDLDNDDDGLTDLNDLCPNHAEDLDGVDDDDGCAEDNDRDGIVDGSDKCPEQAETYNGIDDDDGCPEPDGPRSLVLIGEDSIELAAPIDFRPNTAVLKPRSGLVLDHVAAALIGHQEIVKLTISAHVPASADPEADQYLSQARSDAVKDYLSEAGIDPDRLDAVGFGSSQPRYRNRRARQNARIEIIVAEIRPLGMDVREVDTGGVDLDFATDAPTDENAGEDPEADGGILFDGGFVVEPEAVEPETKKPKGKKTKGKKAKAKKAREKARRGGGEPSEIEFNFDGEAPGESETENKNTQEGGDTGDDAEIEFQF